MAFIIRDIVAGKPKDLTGQKFGKLTAVRPTDQRKGGSVVWECVCDCGKTVFASAQNLKNGHIQSCGCLRKDLAADLTGGKFGKLTAIRPTDQRKCGSIVWECICDCGKTTFVSAQKLKTGHTQSCGCLRKDLDKDLAGRKFGRLTAVRSVDRRRGVGVVWECVCDCGKATFVRTADLKSGHTQSCGCLRKRLGGENER